MIIISLDDYKKEDGSIDWKAYERAQVNNGERCFKCGSFIVFAKGYRDKCASCQCLETDTDSVTHNRFIRCPECRETMDVEDLYEEGSHNVYCEHCDAEFTVATHISFSFESPALK